MSTLTIIVIGGLSFLVVYLLFNTIVLKARHSVQIEQKNRDISALKSTISELDKINKFLNSIIVKNKMQSQIMDLDYDDKKTDVNKEKQFDLDDILSEISKIGIKYLHPDKLDFLKKFKKK